jgi:hypothetical protein
MAAVADHKTVAAPMGNAEQIVRVVFDLAVDDGATGALDLLTADGAIVITDFYVRGITELDSGTDSGTIDVGISGGDTDILLDGVAEATFAADALVQPTIVDGTPNDLPLPLVLASGGKIIQTIGGEEIDTGKIEYFFKYHKFGA